jgi:mono/diheme cytochrome c family protein
MRDALARAIALISFASISFAAGAASETDGLQNFARIEKGRYLATVADCAACHTMPGSGKPFAGGRPIETPFGNILSPNITPDAETGIGAWSDRDFISALKEGTGHAGTRLYPAMPYIYYTKMPDDDVLAIRTYLQTIAPVRNEVEPNQLPFPFNIRAGMIFWNWLYFTPGDWKPVAGKSAEWNRGAYLVEGPMHCGACHTPKSVFGGDRDNRKFQGYSIQGWHAPNITSSKELGIGSWSADQIVQYLKTGHNSTSSASGPMSEEIERSSQLMSPEDLGAIAIYLKDQGTPGNEETVTAVASTDPVFKAGKAIYSDSCAACHRQDGAGVPELFPALRNAPSVRAADPLSLIRVIVEGAKSASTAGAPTGPGMPSYAWQLNDTQIAAVLTYVRNAWGNAAGPVSKHDVQSAKQTLSRETD